MTSRESKSQKRRSSSIPLTVQALSEGLPALQNDLLPPECYVQIKARRLAQAKVLWLNFDLLRDRGIAFPKEGLTPEFEKEILDQFAYAIPQKNDPAQLFGPEEKTFYADRYGGEGLEGNWGSGRAATCGHVQIKGIGRTPLVGAEVQDHHGHGGSSKVEAILEAIWGELLHRELPYNGSRVLAIIDPGTFTFWKDGGWEPRALIVRYDLVRPAHFLAKAAEPSDQIPAHAEHREADKRRVPAALKLLAKNLPHGEAGLTEGLLEFARRIGVHCAIMFARGYYHGTTSPSNRDIQGGILDYGTTTAQPGFGPICTLPEVAAAGFDFEEVKEVNDCLLESIEQNLLPLLKSAEPLPTKEELSAASTESYRSTLELEFLALTGIPREALDKLIHLPEAKILCQHLIEMAQDHTGPKICADKEMPKKVSNYDVRKMLIALAEVHDQGADRITDELTVELAGNEGAFATTESIQLLSTRYSDFMALAKSEILRDDSISEMGLRHFIIHSARLRNRQQPDLYRPILRAASQKIVDAYQFSGNRTTFWDAINERIQRNSRTFDDAQAYEVVLAELRDPLEQTSLRYLFDGKANAEFISFRIPLTKGQIQYRGNRLPEAQVNTANLVLSKISDQMVVGYAAPLQTDGTLHFDVRIPSFVHDPQGMELHLLAANGQKLLKIELKNLLANRVLSTLEQPVGATLRPAGQAIQTNGLDLSLTNILKGTARLPQRQNVGD